MTRIVPYVDGWIGHEQELTVIPRPQFPFRENPTPDTYSRVYERDYLVYPIQFQPSVGIRTNWTNLLTYSESIANAAWTKSAATATDSQGTAPDGKNSLSKVLEAATTAEHFISQAATVPASPVEVSIWGKGGLTRPFVRLAFIDSAAATFSAFFNVNSGYVITPSTGVTASVDGYGNGLFRFRIRFTPAAGAGTVKINLSSDGVAISYAGNIANGAYLWGAQVITLSGDAVPPYIPTTAAARTVIAPNVDRSDAMAYLVQESDPTPQNSEQEIVRRTFARVPLTQIVPSFIRINKPAPSGSLPVQVGDYVINQPNAAQSALDAYFAQNVLTDSGPDIGGGPLTGGTYTLSFDGDTTAAIAFNASASIVQTALNSLGSISDRGGVTVSGDYLSGFTITFSNIAFLTVNTSGLTTSTSAGVQTDIATGFSTGFVQGATLSALPLSASVFTGGTFQITVLGQTTSPIAWNASIGTLQAALNALTNVAARGGVTVPSGPGGGFINYNGNGQISIAAYFQYPAITVNTASLLPVGSTAAVTLVDGTSGFYPGQIPGKTQSLTFTGAAVGDRFVTTISPHGITNSDWVFAKAGSTYYFVAPGLFDASAVNEITFESGAGAILTTTDPITIIGKRIRTGYTPGAFTARCLRTFTFYLPGVTPDINTADDIPLPTYQGDPETMLQMIFSGAGTINYDVGELDPHRGPILSLTVTTIKSTDL